MCVQTSLASRLFSSTRPNALCADDSQHSSSDEGGGDGDSKTRAAALAESKSYTNTTSTAARPSTPTMTSEARTATAAVGTGGITMTQIEESIRLMQEQLRHLTRLYGSAPPILHSSNVSSGAGISAVAASSAAPAVSQSAPVQPAVMLSNVVESDEFDLRLPASWDEFMVAVSEHKHRSRLKLRCDRVADYKPKSISGYVDFRYYSDAVVGRPSTDAGRASVPSPAPLTSATYDSFRRDTVASGTVLRRVYVFERVDDGSRDAKTHRTPPRVSRTYPKLWITTDFQSPDSSTNSPCGAVAGSGAGANAFPTVESGGEFAQLLSEMKSAMPSTVYSAVQLAISESPSPRGGSRSARPESPLSPPSAQSLHAIAASVVTSRDNGACVVTGNLTGTHAVHLIGAKPPERWLAAGSVIPRELAMLWPLHYAVDLKSDANSADTRMRWCVLTRDSTVEVPSLQSYYDPHCMILMDQCLSSLFPNGHAWLERVRASSSAEARALYRDSGRSDLVNTEERLHFSNEFVVQSDSRFRAFRLLFEKSGGIGIPVRRPINPVMIKHWVTADIIRLQSDLAPSFRARKPYLWVTNDPRSGDEKSDELPPEKRSRSQHPVAIDIPASVRAAATDYVISITTVIASKNCRLCGKSAVRECGNELCTKCCTKTGSTATNSVRYYCHQHAKAGTPRG